MKKKQKIPEPTIERLPVYYRCLEDLKESQVSIVSSEDLAEKAGVKASQFRKDLSFFGEFGIQGLGYPVDHLMERIGQLMKLNAEHNVVVAGAGNLGMALARYQGFARWGFKIRYLYDVSPDKVGRKVGELTIENIDDMPSKLDANLGMMAVPSSQAKKVAEKLINAGIKAIINFTGVKLESYPEVVIRNVDVTHELAILNYYLNCGK